MTKPVNRDINSRIKAICDVVFNGNLTQMAKATFISRTTLISITGEQQSSPGYDVLRKIVEMPTVDINKEWLLTGNGEMFSETRLQQQRANDTKNTRPRIPFDAAAGALSIVSDSALEDQCERIPVVSSFPSYDFTIFVNGDSMNPSILSGDELACRFLNSPSFIQWGRLHVIDSEQGVVVKKIYDAKDAIKCHSTNPEYDDFLIPKDEINRIAIVVGLLRRI